MQGTGMEYTPVVTEPVVEIEDTEPVDVTEPETEPVEQTEVVEPTVEETVEVTEPVIEETIAETEYVEPTVSVDSSYLGNFLLTAYCNCTSCCGQYAGGPTATGTTPTAGRTIAVDPSVIPYGSRVVINGNTYVAEDCGGAIKGNRIDVYFDSHEEALNFGVQYADVYWGS